MMIRLERAFSETKKETFSLGSQKKNRHTQSWTTLPQEVRGKSCSGLVRMNIVSKLVTPTVHINLHFFKDFCSLFR
jgi:hypothetical protein